MPSPGLSQSMRHLLTETPPPSPGLPSLRPRHGKKMPPRRYKLFVRVLSWLLGVTVITWYAMCKVEWDGTLAGVSHAQEGKAYELKGEGPLPAQPAPVIVTDKRGRAKWTMSIPPTAPFPLPPEQYLDMCDRSGSVAATVAHMKSHAGGSDYHAGHANYYHADQNYMDVAEAERHGLLPGTGDKAPAVQQIWDAVMGKEHENEADLMGEDQDTLAGQPVIREGSVCSKSLTYVLESTDAGLGLSLMSVWLSYGLAQKEGRAFFIDDTNWAYGKWSTYFTSIPVPSCRPPPRTQIVPCPHHARHLLVSMATTSLTFGHAFHDAFEDARGMEVQRQRPIFGLMRQGYEALFHLRHDDEAWALKRKEELHALRAKGSVVGIHVRHGDRHPLEFQYQRSYIPLDRYAAAAKDLLQSKPNSTAATHMEILVASDDSDVYTSEEFSRTSRAQDRIVLASKAAIHAAHPQVAPSGPFRPGLDENIGWEGGFFQALFWSLGSAPSSSANAAQQGNVEAPSPLALRLRELVGRTYLLDLKVLGEDTDGVVCGVSATGCKLLAVMMGWDKAMVAHRWKNIDGDFDWNGLVW
ncbi:MAG: hypothetical protein M1838_000309 [Thelocarpon superellum]|nr:MAG: hypothetical protein M1838_000309 [Thelocarpon superellum]